METIGVVIGLLFFIAVFAVIVVLVSASIEGNKKDIDGEPTSLNPVIMFVVAFALIALALGLS